VEAGTRAPDELTLEEMIAVADDLITAGCKQVSLTGGEPLLHPQWPTLAKYLAEREVNVKIVSNGLRLDDAAIATMVDVGVLGVSISLDGMREEHDRIRRPPGLRALSSRFDTAIDALERLVASPLKTAVVTHIHRGNFDELEQMYDLLGDLGVELWQLQLAYPLGRLLSYEGEYLISPAQLPELEQRIGDFVRAGRMHVIASDNIGYYGRNEPVIRSALHGKHTFWTGCMAGCLAVCVGSTGDVKGCPSQPDEFVVGNVREESLLEIWKDSARFAYNTQWDESQLEGQCAECSYKSLCRAGCTTMAYATTGSIYDNPFCLLRSRP
jgi:radical SAM protein with 4Fe4S-binding SPASM domain